MHYHYQKFLLSHTYFILYYSPRASFIEYRFASFVTIHFATFIAPFEKVFLAVAVWFNSKNSPSLYNPTVCRPTISPPLNAITAISSFVLAPICPSLPEILTLSRFKFLALAACSANVNAVPDGESTLCL